MKLVERRSPDLLLQLSRTISTAAMFHRCIRPLAPNVCMPSGSHGNLTVTRLWSRSHRPCPIDQCIITVLGVSSLTGRSPHSSEQNVLASAKLCSRCAPSVHQSHTIAASKDVTRLGLRTHTLLSQGHACSQACLHLLHHYPLCLTPLPQHTSKVSAVVGHSSGLRRPVYA